MKGEQSGVAHAAQKVTREERRWGNMPPPRCKEGDMATAPILHSIVWLSSPSFSPPSLRRPPSQCCKDFVGVAEEGEKSFALLLRLLLLIDIDGAAAAHVAETHLGIDNETSDLCTDGADMDSQSEQTAERGGVLLLMVSSPVSRVRAPLLDAPSPGRERGGPGVRVFSRSW